MFVFAKHTVPNFPVSCMSEPRREILGWAGVMLVCAGLGWIYLPLAPIALGCVLVIVAVRGR